MATSQLWSGRSHVATFVHTLHLLDLDQRDDWPDVSIQTFEPKSNLQHRLRCIEWSLYRLFELYDAKATRDKLRPFFPPATSLQSVNLRAALLRQLTDLKKDGALGGNVILRKTMLDECKGDKFEELLAVFSVMVLKKVLTASKEHIGISTVKTTNLVPLVLSHRKAIQRDLEKRKELDLRTRQQQRNMDATIKALSEEAVAWKNRKAPSIPKNADVLKRLVRENWIGDTDWVETILHGVPPTPGLAHDDFRDDDDDYASLPLIDLDSRVRTQNARLAHWQEYLNKLQKNRRPEPKQPQSRIEHLPSSSGIFERHQDITLNGDLAEQAAPELKLNPRHVRLLASMEDGLSSGKQRSAAPHNQVNTKISTPRANKPLHRQESASRLFDNHATVRRSSDASSQGTVVAGHLAGERGRTFDSARGQQISDLVTPTRKSSILSSSPDTTQLKNDQMSLMERTRASMAQFETPRAKLARSRTTISPARDEPGPTITATRSNLQNDRLSLAERTRQSMSLLANVLDDNYQPKGTGKPQRPRHTKSKSMYIPTQRPRLERAWSEESLASAAKEDGVDMDADYESVFKSRPRLAMSPNLSPARNSEQLDADLEDALNKLTINSSSPDY